MDWGIAFLLIYVGGIMGLYTLGYWLFGIWAACIFPFAIPALFIWDLNRISKAHNSPRDTDK